MYLGPDLGSEVVLHFESHQEFIQLVLGFYRSRARSLGLFVSVHQTSAAAGSGGLDIRRGIESLIPHSSCIDSLPC